MELAKKDRKFVSYEYKYISGSEEYLTLMVDGYKNFGWEMEETTSMKENPQKSQVKLKRDWKIVNKAELTRLQQHFESAASEIQILQKKQHTFPTMVAITVGILGTAFMALSTFSITAASPSVFLCVLFAIPGFLGWIAPYFIYKELAKKEYIKLQPFIDKKYDEVYEICEKGFVLL